MLLLWLLSLIGLLGILSYHRLPLFTSSLLTACWFAVGTALGVVGWLGWLVALLIALPLNVTRIRQRLFSARLLKAYRSVMPEMSKTEQDAIDAGTTWWEADLFRGNPDWHKLHNYPKPQLSEEEQAFLDGPVTELCKMVDDFEITHELADLPPDIWDYIKHNGFFSMIIKKEYGGLEFSAYAQSVVLQRLAGVSGVLASTVGVPNSLGPGELLQHYGTDQQKEYYLPRLARGEEVPCFALTSPEAGSDAGAIPDSGVVCMGEWQNEQILGIKLTWNKRYITLAPVATVLGLAFKLRDPEHLLGEEDAPGITCALIPTDTPGVEIGRRHFPLNLPFMNGPTRGHEVFVPIDYIIGGSKMAGQGWRMLVECLSVGRAITLPSNSTGGTKMAAMASGAYARIRRQFKIPIGKMEGIEEPLARIAANAYLMDATASLTTTAIDAGEKPSVISAIVKYHLTTRGQQSLIDAMDIHGGKGICMGPNNYLARAYQGAPIAITVEGANILTRSMIIYGQGAIRCHPYLLKEMKSAASQDSRTLENFDQALIGHIGFAMSNGVRSLWFALGGWRFIRAPFADQTARYYRLMTRYASHLALLSDVAMGLFGGSLKRRERLSARLGDILSQLYLASATLKRFNDEGRRDEDWAVVQWAVSDALHRAQHALTQLLDNLPVRWAGMLLKLIIQPFGPLALAPSDQQDHQLAQIMIDPRQPRVRLFGHQLWLTNDENNAVGRMQQTLADMVAVEPIVARLNEQLSEKNHFMFLDKLADEALVNGWITEEEAELLRRTEQGRLAAINVDDFEPQALAANTTNTKPQTRRKQKEDSSDIAAA